MVPDTSSSCTAGSVAEVGERQTDEKRSSSLCLAQTSGAGTRDEAAVVNQVPRQRLVDKSSDLDFDALRDWKPAQLTDSWLLTRRGRIAQLVPVTNPELVRCHQKRKLKAEKTTILPPRLSSIILEYFYSPSSPKSRVMVNFVRRPNCPVFGCCGN